MNYINDNYTDDINYKNIVFDFGNVLGTFCEHEILSAFCEEKDEAIFKDAVFHNWQALDAGSILYEEYISHALSLLPARLHENAVDFFQNWHRQMPPIMEVWEFVRELKEQGYRLYILSNAPVHFAEHADFFEIVEVFDGVVFSGSVHMWKPNPDIYHYLFEHYHLKPEECFFIDDREENIRAAENCGMDGIIFDGNVSAVREKLR